MTFWLSMADKALDIRFLRFILFARTDKLAPIEP